MMHCAQGKGCVRDYGNEHNNAEKHSVSQAEVDEVFFGDLSILPPSVGNPSMSCETLKYLYDLLAAAERVKHFVAQ